MGFIRKFAAAVLMVLMCAVCVSAESGSVLVLQQKDGAPIPGGSLTIYYVGEMGQTVALSDSFASSGVVITDIHSPDAAQVLADYARAQKLAGLEKTISQEGTAEFSDLEDGVYLIVQDTAAAGYSRCRPFLVSVSLETEQSRSYSVIVKPKMAPEIPEETTPSSTPKTGDNSALALWLVLLAASAIALGFMLWRRGKRKA